MARDPVEALLTALRGLARARGAGIASIARAGGQDRVKISLRAFYKYHEEETGYRLLEEVLADIGEEGLKRLEELGIRIIRRRDGVYIEVPISLLEE